MAKLLPLFLIMSTFSFGSEKTFEVYATREGLVGRKTATGHIIKPKDIFVALPSRKALNRKVKIYYGNKIVICRVLDVGPWSIYDDYWNKSGKPLSESGKQSPSRKRKVLNKAGIDLSDGLWDFLGIDRKIGIVKIKWQFAD